MLTLVIKSYNAILSNFCKTIPMSRRDQLNGQPPSETLHSAAMACRQATR